MSIRARAILICLALAAAACGHNIGDSCSVSTDCAPDGTRVCDTFSPGGYCTIQGCDYGTCPSEAVCVRFFPGLEHTKACTTSGDCSIDELCTVGGQCAPRSIELRFCMMTCGSGSDCRSGYECRTLQLMKTHGGEPVPDPSSLTSTVPDQAFCASQQSCTFETDCPTGETCNKDSHTCSPI